MTDLAQHFIDCPTCYSGRRTECATALALARPGIPDADRLDAKFLRMMAGHSGPSAAARLLVIADRLERGA